MKPVPGNTLAAIALGLAALSGAYLFGVPVGPVLAVGWIGLAAASAYDAWRVRQAMRDIVVEAHVPERSSRGRSVVYKLVVQNNGSQRLLASARPELPEAGVPRDVIVQFALPPAEPQEAGLSLHMPERGEHRFGTIHFRVQSPWRLFQWQFMHSFEQTCRVYPDIETVKEHLRAKADQQTALQVQTSRYRGVGSEFESLRDYEYGDEIRRIDWRATAKHQRPIVRNYEIETHRNVMIVIDRGRLMAARTAGGAKLDHAIDSALLIAGVALKNGDRCGLLVFDDEVALHLKPRGGLPQLTRITEALVGVQPRMTESHFRKAFIVLQQQLTKRSLVVVITDVADSETARPLIAGTRALGQRHLMVTAALRTPELEGVLEKPSMDVMDPFRKAVTYRLRRERSEVLARIHRDGAYVLDVRPEDLRLPLVNKYVELREMNLL